MAPTAKALADQNSLILIAKGCNPSVENYTVAIECKNITIIVLYCCIPPCGVKTADIGFPAWAGHT